MASIALQRCIMRLRCLVFARTASAGDHLGAMTLNGKGSAKGSRIFTVKEYMRVAHFLPLSQAFRNVQVCRKLTRMIPLDSFAEHEIHRCSIPRGKGASKCNRLGHPYCDWPLCSFHVHLPAAAGIDSSRGSHCHFRASHECKSVIRMGGLAISALKSTLLSLFAGLSVSKGISLLEECC